MKILVVEDDAALNRGISLSFQGETVLSAYSVKEAEELLDESVDLMILDVNLPDGNGLDYCRRVREASDVPIIFLTANDLETDVVAGLESGGDDYVTKPFSLAVLRARVHTVLRRKKKERQIFRQDDFAFDFENMIFTVKDMPAELSKTEQRLLKALVMNRGNVLSRDLLLERIWNGGEYVEENALSVTMRRLREKLPGIPVKTVYGVGYLWEK